MRICDNLKVGSDKYPFQFLPGRLAKQIEGWEVVEWVNLDQYELKTNRALAS